MIVAKNIVLGAILLANVLFMTVLFSIRPGLPLLRVATVITGVAYGGLTTLGAGNLFAVWSPAGIDYGGLRSRNVSGMAVLGAVLTQFTILGSLAGVMWASARWGAEALPLYCFATLAVVAMAFYLFSVGFLGARASRPLRSRMRARCPRSQGVDSPGSTGIPFRSVGNSTVRSDRR